ncbi:MAG: hypothetical protein EAZ55_06255 [Cytophagales bacterium]|nr:MAG: hypothetical protein EAZ55_06255 [Cytophagales bacterium]
MRKIFSSLFSIIIANFLFITIATAQPEADEVLKSFFQFMPSPIEMTSLVKDNNIAYDAQLLNKISNQKYYADDYKQAVNLGVYSTDLGYATIYTKPDALSYLNVVKVLADSLSVGNYINIETIQKLALSNNLNQLLSETAMTFEKINDHLINNKKPQTAAFMLIGGWAETVYLTARVAQVANDNTLINSKVVEQKFVLDELIKAIEPYKKDRDMNDLLYELNKIKVEMDKAFSLLEKNGAVKLDEIAELNKLINNFRDKLVL